MRGERGGTHIPNAIGGSGLHLVVPPRVAHNCGELLCPFRDVSALVTNGVEVLGDSIHELLRRNDDPITKGVGKVLLSAVEEHLSTLPNLATDHRDRRKWALVSREALHPFQFGMRHAWVGVYPSG